MQKMSASH